VAEIHDEKADPMIVMPVWHLLNLGDVVNNFDFIDNVNAQKTVLVGNTDGRVGTLIGWYLGHVELDGTFVRDNPNPAPFLTYQGSDGNNWDIAIVQDIGGYGVVNTPWGTNPLDYIGDNGMIRRPDPPGNNNMQIEIRDSQRRKLTLQITSGPSSPVFRVIGVGY
jgi:hypothetical protein